MSRVDSRKDIPVDNRVTLLEADLDGLEQATRENNEKMTRLVWAVVGLIMSVAGTLVTFVVLSGAHK